VDQDSALNRGLLLDEALAATRLAWRGLGMVWLMSLPWWLLVAEGLGKLGMAGQHRVSVADGLQWAAAATAALVLAAWGRAAWARQVALALDGQVDPSLRMPLHPRVPLGDALIAVWLHCLMLLIAMAMSWMILPLLFLPWTLALAAAGAAIRPGATAWAAFAGLVGSAIPLRPWLGAWVGVGLAGLLVAINLWLAGYGLTHLLAEGAGVPTYQWTERLAPWNHGPWIAVLVLGWALIDPLVITAAVVHQRRCQSRTTGSDLSAWLKRLERSS
jgi:hypothetical protein